jgi:ketosteroid isomerase-like protein
MSVVDPLRRMGSDAARKRLAEWFAWFRGPIGYELRALSITAGDDVAFCHSLNRVNPTTTDGRKLDMWWRATVCYRTWPSTASQNSPDRPLITSGRRL